MNLAIRGIEANLGPEPADSFHRDLHKDLKADFVLANPPFNMTATGAASGCARTCAGSTASPPAGNANFAWVQHFIHHLAPTGVGRVRAGERLACRRTSRARARSGRRIVEADLVDCMVAMPGQLFYSTQIPVCLWFLARDKQERRRSVRDRRGETLFIDARKLGPMIDRTHRELTDDGDRADRGDVPRLARGDGAGKYEDVPGFCKSATLEEIAQRRVRADAGPVRRRGGRRRTTASRSRQRWRG